MTRLARSLTPAVMLVGARVFAPNASAVRSLTGAPDSTITDEPGAAGMAVSPGPASRIGTQRAIGGGQRQLGGS